MVRRLQPTLEEAELGVKNGNSAALVYSKSGLAVSINSWYYAWKFA